MRLVSTDHVDEQHEPDLRGEWATDLAERLDGCVDGLIDVTEMLLATLEAGGGRDDDLVVRRARRLLDEHLQGLGSVGAQLWVGPPEVEHEPGVVHELR